MNEFSPFHVKHNAQPVKVKEVLLLLESCNTVEEMLELGAARGYAIGTTATSVKAINGDPIKVSRDLGLVKQGTYNLTETGREVVALLTAKPKTVNEFLHFKHYTLWSPISPQKFCFSWSYKTFCDILWDLGTAQVVQEQLVNQVENLAREEFQIKGISVGTRSAEGVLKWVNELDPSLLSDQHIGKQHVKTFSRRAFCPPETFVLAVDYVYRRNNIGYQTNMLLDPEKQEAICKVCLLDPTEFDNVLEWACGQYDFLSQGSRGGWGRYVVLARPPALADFMG